MLPELYQNKAVGYATRIISKQELYSFCNFVWSAGSQRSGYGGMLVGRQLIQRQLEDATKIVNRICMKKLYIAIKMFDIFLPYT